MKKKGRYWIMPETTESLIMLFESFCPSEPREIDLDAIIINKDGMTLGDLHRLNQNND